MHASNEGREPPSGAAELRHIAFVHSMSRLVLQNKQGIKKSLYLCNSSASFEMKKLFKQVLSGDEIVSNCLHSFSTKKISLSV